MIRKFILTPGYDCIAKPCGEDGCGERPGSNHGAHCDDWIYVVQDGDVALSLTVYSGNYPRRPMRAEGADMTLHVGFPITVDQVRGLRDGISECEFVAGGHCYQGGRFSGVGIARAFVDQFFVRHGGSEQTEGFWRPFEERCREWASKAREERADVKWSRCQCCDGIGAVSP